MVRIWRTLACDWAIGTLGRQGLWKASTLVILTSVMPLMHRGGPSSLTAGPSGTGVRTSRPQTQIWKECVVLQLCLFGLWNTRARRHSVRSKISGTAAWWLMQLNKSRCWHSTTITNPIVSNASARWIAQTFGSTLKYTHLITAGPIRGKMTWYLCGRKVPVTFWW